MLCLLVGLLIGSASVRAQEKTTGTFVYLEDAQGSPFYLRNGTQVFSSSAAGYLILHGLKPGTYQVSIGFPRNEFPEMQFDLPVHPGQDAGYLIRRRGSTGQFELYNLETALALEPLDLVHINAGDELARLSPGADRPVAAAAIQPQETPASPLQQDQLQGATSASTPQVQPQVAPAVQGTNLPQAANADQQLAAMLHPDQPQAVHEAADASSGTMLPQQASKPAPNQAVLPETQPIQAAPYQPTQVGQPQSSEGLTFITFTSDSSSTPPAATMSEEDSSMAAASSRSSKALEQAIQERWSKLFRKRASHSDSGQQEEQAASAPQNIPTPPANPVEPVSARGARNRDFQRWRRQLASRSDDAAMLSYVRDHLSESPPFSCQQLQSLSYLFLTDASRLSFLELLLPHAGDPSQASGLSQVFGSASIRDAFMSWLRQQHAGS